MHRTSSGPVNLPRSSTGGQTTLRAGAGGLGGRSGPFSSPPPPVWHSVGLHFLSGALGSPPFFPPRAAAGRCVLTAAAAGVPCGVVAALAEPSSWRTGGCAGVVLRCLLPTPLRVQVVHHMPRRVSVCVRPKCSTPPHVVLVVHHPPPHAAACVRPTHPPPSGGGSRDGSPGQWRGGGIYTSKLIATTR